jgi:D-alanyl-D-alanine carboxypeptidase (penicillin-binding protein 5/6)
VPRRWLAAALALAAGSARGGELPDPFPQAGAAYLVALGDEPPIWGRAPDAPRLPASLTKLMTALLALEERGADADAWVTVSARAAAETGSRAGLRRGEAITRADAITATLVASANDACLALAEHVGGSVATFVERMNRRALALGLTGTHFENPCGHDAPGHRSTARDLLVLARAALAVPGFRRIVAEERATVRTRAGRTIALRTHNVLLGRLPGASGVKSGYTEGAGQCVVALARRGDVEVLVVLLGAPDRWWAAAALLEAGFAEARRRG